MVLRVAGLLHHHWGKALFLAVLLVLLNSHWSPPSSPLSLSSQLPSWTSPWSGSRGKKYLAVSGTIKKHPIERLVEDGESRFRQQLKGQSISLKEAISEYHRRYGREPPKGFDAWYDAAVEKNGTIIDDYDGIHDALQPFWALSARDIRDRIQAVVESKDWLDVYNVRNHDVVGAVKGDPIAAWIRAGAKYLPDTQIPYNHLAESRVAVPHEDVLKEKDLCRPKEGSKESEERPFLALNHQKTWPHIVKSCPPDSAARDGERSPPDSKISDDESLRFVNDVPSVMNLCDNPELEKQHGNLISPDTTLLAQRLLPVFSRNKLSTFGDILVPTPSYGWQSGKLTDEEHVPWEKKGNGLYWSGTTTGGYSHDNLWRFTQRFRFVSLMNDNARDALYMRKVKGDVWEKYQGKIESISKHVIAKFTKQKLCEEADCKAQKEDPTILFGNRDDPAEYKRHRLVMDLDGQASTDRYYKLLASGSTVLKQTLMREWHDERLTPWVHYIPISTGLEELPEVVRFLTHEAKGQAIAKKIARQGQEWWSRGLRYDDMTLYVHRLMLEWARLIDPARDENLAGCKDM